MAQTTVFKTQFNFTPGKQHREKCNSISLTSQRQSYTVKELLERYTQGTMPNVAKTTFFDPSPDLDKPLLREDLDISEVHNRFNKMKYDQNVKKIGELDQKIKYKTEHNKKVTELKEKKKLLEQLKKQQ